jgi:hypothetical protein
MFRVCILAISDTPKQTQCMHSIECNVKIVEDLIHLNYLHFDREKVYSARSRSFTTNSN